MPEDEDTARNRRFHWEWNLGRYAPPRRPEQTDLPSDFLSENADNLALVLNDLERHSAVKADLVERLKQADNAIESFSTIVQGGTIQLFLHYSGLRFPIPPLAYPMERFVTFAC